MITKNLKIQKLISTLLVVVILIPSILLSRPQKAEAVWWSTWVTDIMTGNTTVQTTATTGSTLVNTALSLKSFAKAIAKQVLMTIARRALQGITKSTTTWINTGYWGNPLFLENPQSFFKDIAKYEVKNFVDEIGYDRLRRPFGKSFALNTIYLYKNAARDNAEYSLSRVIRDPVFLQRYRSDFRVGGWDGFMLNTQYPNNNYIGAQMLYSDEIARRVAGTSQNAAGKVKDTVQQGLGFLSPQTCITRPEYNSMKNEFQTPSFDSAKFSVDWYKANPSPTAQTSDEREAYEAKYQKDLADAKATWGETNVCPKQRNGISGLVSTTPGSIVGNAITKALGATQDSVGLAAAMGNSVSAILDSLLNKFLQKGLNKLASRVNPVPDDTWSYNGETLGVTPYGSTDWSNGPDIEIDLNVFKAHVETDIKNTEQEILLLDNYRSVDAQGNLRGDAGTLQILEATWPKMKELDICLPGPEVGWEARLDKEMERATGPMSEKLNKEDQQKAAAAQLAINELQYAVNFFKDWIKNKMYTELPDSINYMDTVDGLSDLPQQASQLIDARRTRNQALARLKAIQGALAQFTTQPAPGSGGEKALINLKKQYDANLDGVANEITIEGAVNDLKIAKDRYFKLVTSINQCTVERTARGGAVPGVTMVGGNYSWANVEKSSYLRRYDLGGNNPNNPTGTEGDLFCYTPIWQGYSHNMFNAYDYENGKNGAVTPPLPNINSRNVLSWPRFGGIFGTKHVDVDLSCDLITNATVMDYKGLIPGVTYITDAFVDVDPVLGPPQADTPPPTDGLGCKAVLPPILPIDRPTLTTYVVASFRGLYGRDPIPGEQGPGDINYWVNKTIAYDVYSDNICRVGWNLYRETQMSQSGREYPGMGDQMPQFLP